MAMVDLGEIQDHYEQALARSGDNGARVGWRNSRAQLLRFEVIWGLLSGSSPRSITDVGCGMGDLLPFLRWKGWMGQYCGVDISPKMITSAVERLSNDLDARFINSIDIPQADIIISSGIFNVSLQASAGEWTQYCKDLICQMWGASHFGIVFNMLSTDSEVNLRRPELTYFNPSEWLDFVRSELSSHVRLDQTYGQFDFSLAVFRTSLTELS